MGEQGESGYIAQGQQRKQLSRQEFIKLLGTVGAAELIFGPVEKIIGLFGDFRGAAGEGNPVQRIATLDRLASDIATHPLDGRYPRALKAWVKFSGAEVYAQKTAVSYSRT